MDLALLKRCRRIISVNPETSKESVELDLKCCDLEYRTSQLCNQHYKDHHREIPLSDPIEWHGVFIRPGREQEHQEANLKLSFVPFPPKQNSTSTWSVRNSSRTSGTREHRERRRKNPLPILKGDILTLNNRIFELQRNCDRLEADNEILENKVNDLQKKGKIGKKTERKYHLHKKSMKKLEAINANYEAINKNLIITLRNVKQDAVVSTKRLSDKIAKQSDELYESTLEMEILQRKAAKYDILKMRMSG